MSGSRRRAHPVLRASFPVFVLKYGLIAFALLVVFSNAVVTGAGRGRIYRCVGDLPRNRVGLLLGTSPYLVGGRSNPFFDNRIDATVELLDAGRIERVIVSGDNRHRTYNEPVKMRDALLERGVPASNVVLDFAGFRTLDSIVRASRVFGQDRFTVITQEFHVHRALYIAHHYRLDAVAYVARDVPGYAGLRVHARELFARTLAILDLHVLGTRPRFLGDLEPVE